MGYKHRDVECSMLDNGRCLVAGCYTGFIRGGLVLGVTFFLRWVTMVTLALVFMLFCIPCMGLAENSPSGPIRIGIIGDQTGTQNLEQAYAALEQGVNLLSKQNIDMALHVGDMVESREPEADYIRRFNTAAGILDKLGVPWFLTPGDHDVNPPTFLPGSKDRSRESLFRSLYSKRFDRVNDQLYYSFDFNGVHFIALYSHDTLHADSRWGNTFLAKISDAQFQWLAKDLEKNRDARAVIVFTHQPLWYNWSGWSRVHKLLRQFPVKGVVAGHFHYDQTGTDLDGIRYTVVGATGGAVKQASRDAGGIWHVTVMTLENHRLRFELLALDGSSPMTLTPRTDMDRVQSIDSMLSGMWNFSRNNPLYLSLYPKDLTLYTDCSAQKKARLTLTHLGNPIDLPVTIHVAVKSKNLDLALPQFTPGMGQTKENGTSCVLPPGKRVVVSNTSSVRFTHDGSLPEPAWTATPLITGPAPVPGGRLHLSITLSFRGDSGPLSVHRDLFTPIMVCKE